ncbi:MAG: hypothetical protein IPG63_17750 [Xanthomonadales bacterium]|nr:hypothetical protein [Xanthomonadales bacterium]
MTSGKRFLLIADYNAGANDASDLLPRVLDRAYLENWDSNAEGDWDYVTYVDGERIAVTVDGVDGLFETRNHVIHLDNEEAHTLEGGGVSDRPTAVEATTAARSRW